MITGHFKGTQSFWPENSLVTNYSVAPNLGNLHIFTYCVQNTEDSIQTLLNSLCEDHLLCYQNYNFSLFFCVTILDLSQLLNYVLLFMLWELLCCRILAIFPLPKLHFEHLVFIPQRHTNIARFSLFVPLLSYKRFERIVHFCFCCTWSIPLFS